MPIGLPTRLKTKNRCWNDFCAEQGKQCMRGPHEFDSGLAIRELILHHFGNG